MKKRIVVLSGAGISADSGLRTFRDADGLWEGYDVSGVATPEAFERDPELVIRFYNERRAQAREAEPNEGHRSLVKLESKYDVQIITQNIDDLHERAGSTHVLHLHGEILKGCSVKNTHLTVDLKEDIKLGDLAPDGHQLRPFVVWFGEPVPMIEQAARICLKSDILIIVGTSLVVYPAASLIDFVPVHAPIYVVDPQTPHIYASHQIEYITERGSVGLPILVEKLLNT